MKKIAIITACLCLLLLSDAFAFTVFYTQKPDGNGRHAILFVLPENTEDISAVSFDESTIEGKQALECINAWNVKRRMNRYYVGENPDDGSKVIMERSDFTLPSSGSLISLQPLCLNPSLTGGAK
jgi:hypothetical protein